MVVGLKSKPLSEVRASVPVAEVTKTEPVRINLNIQQTTRDNWKRAGIDLGMTMTAMIEAAMVDYLDKHHKK